MRCELCKGEFDLGPLAGNLWRWYPEGQQRHWRHMRSPQHKAACDARGRVVSFLLPRIDPTMKAARDAQKPDSICKSCGEGYRPGHFAEHRTTHQKVAA